MEHGSIDPSTGRRLRGARRPRVVRAPQTQEFTDEEFNRLFRKRGITDPKVLENAFYKYEQGGSVDLTSVFTYKPPEGETNPVALMGAALAAIPYAKRCRRLATKSPGMLMRRFPVPEGHPFIFNEQRPEWAIWVGRVTEPPMPHDHAVIFKHNDDREDHLGRNRDTPSDVFRAMRLEEYQVLAGDEHFAGAIGHEAGEPNYGADHFGTDLEGSHVHVDIAKYVFPPNVRDWVLDPDGPHDHDEYRSDWRRLLHESWHHARTGEPRDGEIGSFMSEMNRERRRSGSYFVGLQPFIRGEHEHHREEDVTHEAARLSWHPYKRDERWKSDRVFMALEGSLKEASLVCADEASFSAPSVTLWRAPELLPFADKHLRGKRVYIVTDSDWEPRNRRLKDDRVISQALMLQDTLKRWQVDAYIAAPPHGTEFPDPIDPRNKRGVDDWLGMGGTVDDLRVVEIVPRPGLREWVTEARRGERGRWKEGRDNDVQILEWLSRYSANARCRWSLRAIARSIQSSLGAEARDGQPVFEDKVEQVRLTVHSLGQPCGKENCDRKHYGALAIRGSLRDRTRGRARLRRQTRQHLRRQRTDWTGSIQLVEELRSDVRTRRLGG